MKSMSKMSLVFGGVLAVASVFADDLSVYKVTADVNGVDLTGYAPDRMEGPAPGATVTIDGSISNYEATVEQPFTFQGDSNATSASYGTLNLKNTGTLTDGSVPLAFSGYGVTYFWDPYLVGPGWTKARLQVKDDHAAARFKSVRISGTKETPARFDLTPDGPKNEKGQGKVWGLATAPGSRGFDELKIGFGDNGDGVMTLTDCETFFGDYVYIGASGSNVAGTLALTNSWMDVYYLRTGFDTPTGESGSTSVTNAIVLGPGSTFNISLALEQHKDSSLKFLFAGGTYRARMGGGYIFKSENDGAGHTLVTNAPGCDFIFDVPDANWYSDLYPAGRSVDFQGDGNLVKRGPGVLKVAAPVHYTGETRLEQGTLRISSDDPLPHTPVRAAAGTKIDLENGGRLVVPSIEGKVSISSSSGGSFGTLAIGDEKDITLSGVAANVNLEKIGSGTMTTYGQRGNVLKVSEGRLIVAASAKPWRYWRFRVDGIRGNVDMMQFSELKLYSGETDVTKNATVTWDTEHTTAKHAGDNKGLPYPAAETPEKAVDGNVDTKWLDWRAGVDESDEVRDSVWLRFDFGEAKCAVTKYEWYTANDVADRDPTSWSFQSSDDGVEWVDVDVQVNYGVTQDRKALAYAYVSDVGLGGDETLDKVVVAKDAELVLETNTLVVADLAASEGRLTLDDESSVELVSGANEIRQAAFGAVTGVGGSSLAKTGSGTTLLAGLDGFKGRLDVQEGQLEIRDKLIDSRAKYYRWTVKRVYGNNDIMQLSEFSLYDRGGNRVNVGMTRAADGTTALQPGECAQVGSYSTGGGEIVDMAFDGKVDTKWCLTNVTMNDPAKPDTWRAVVLRLKDDAEPVVSYSFTTANDSTPARNPSTWQLEASFDGVEWFVVDERTDVGVQPSQTKTESEHFVIAEFSDKGTGGDAKPAFAEGSAVSVAKDARLVLDDGGVTSVHGLVIDVKAGAGTIANFKAAEAGEIRLENVEDIDALVGKDLITFETPADLASLRNWTVVVNGVVNPKLRVVVKDGRLTVVKKSGLTILIL